MEVRGGGGGHYLNTLSPSIIFTQMTIKPPTFAEDQMLRAADCTCESYQCFGATRGMFRTVFSETGDHFVGLARGGIADCRDRVTNLIGLQDE